MIRPHVVVDGSNIATEGRSTPSLRQLDEAVRAFIAEHPSDIVTVVVDATFGHRIDPSERAEFDDAVSSGEIITAPAGAIGRGDAFILQIAEKAEATILSNDSFQEFHGQHEWLFDEGRLVGGKPVPGVGWVFLLRSPVRGPASRRAVKDARDGAKDKTAKDKAAKDKAAKDKTAKDKAARDKDRGRARHREKEPKEAGRAPSAEKAEKPSKLTEQGTGTKAEGKDSKRGRKKRSKPTEAINEPLPFIEFVASHPVGTVVEATVTRFSSHGAYVEVDGVTCYVPLRLMGAPPPRSARDVLQLGETRKFAVHTIDAALRGIDLALVATREDERENVREAMIDLADEESITQEPSPAADEEATKTNTSASLLATTFTADQHAEEAQVTPAKKAASKRAAKKTTAKRAAKKAPARKATKRAPAKKKAAARKTTARKTTAKRSAKKATAKRTATKRATTKKAAAKRASTTKRATKKAAAKKSTAKRTAKTVAKRAPAKKSAAKRTAKKASARR